jgi:hypothetical protein
MTRLARLLFVGACTGGAIVPVFADAGEPTREELLDQIRRLEARVAQLELDKRSAPTTDPAAVDRVVEQVIRDAQRRSSLFMFQDVTLTGGYDEEREIFLLGSEDGNYLLVPHFLLQVRHTTNHSEGDGTTDDQTENGFEIRRAKMTFEGNVFSPDWLYRLQWETNSNGGDLFLQDAWVRYRFADDWAVQVGQFWDIPFHEQSTPEHLHLAADRSLLNALIGGGQTDRVQGAMLMYDDKEHWRGQVLVHDGYNSDNTNFIEAGGTAFIGAAPTNFGVSGRIEYFFRGTRRDYEDFSAIGNTEDLLVLGAGASFSQAGDSDVIFHTIDVQWENADGLGAYGALYGLARDIGAGSPVPTGDHYDWGILAQANYLFSRKLEGFARYDVTFLEEDALPAGAEEDVHEIMIGANYYFNEHHLKLTIDGAWLPNGSPAAVPGLGILQGTEDQFILRAQFQLFI